MTSVLLSATPLFEIYPGTHYTPRVFHAPINTSPPLPRSDYLFFWTCVFFNVCLSQPSYSKLLERVCSYYPAVRTYCVQTVYNSTAGNRPMYTIYFVHP